MFELKDKVRNMDCSFWNILLAIATIIIALATCVAAYGAWASARSTERAVRGQLLFHFLNEYSDEKMRDSLMVLGENKGDIERIKCPRMMKSLVQPADM